MTGEAYLALFGATVVLLLMYNRARGLLKWAISAVLLSESILGILYFASKLAEIH